MKTLYYQNSILLLTYYGSNIDNFCSEFGSSSMYQKLEKRLMFSILILNPLRTTFKQ